MTLSISIDQKESIGTETKSAPVALKWFASAFIVLFGISYYPIEIFGGGFGPLKLGMMMLAAMILICFAFRPSNAMIMGSLYFGYQLFSASLHPETLRWSTLLFSAGLVYAYVCMYNLIYIFNVFSIDSFLKLVRRMITAYFIVCVIQQILIIAGMKYFPLVNMISDLNRGIGCNSLSMEPSTFARFMLVFYYAYVKCSEYKRGKGPFSIKELLSGEHRNVTLMFFWMMTTMGSGTAFVCLIVFACYFINRKNYGYMLPFLAGCYIVLQFLPFTQLQRATSVINATSTFDQSAVMETDGSAGSRISPLINSFHADFSRFETWFGYGIDYAKENNLVLAQKATLFDDYGFIAYILAIIMNFTCAYRFFSLATLFMIIGVGGGAGTNIHYTWTLMAVMTAIRYFYDTVQYPRMLSERKEQQQKFRDYKI